MNRLALIAATIAVLGVAGCGSSSSNPNAPSDITIFTVPLSALNEVPPITNAEAGARGTAVITINKAKNTIDFNVSLTGFTPTSAVNIAHIHGPAPVGQNATIVVSTTLTPGTVALVNGAGTFSFPEISAPAATIASILAAPQNFYFNVHTTLNGGGAIRGQLQ